MKQVANIILLLLIPFVSVFAQTQQGYVKTQGRPGKPGQPLANVTLRWSGIMKAVLSNSDGTFNVTFPDKKPGDAIKLTNVSKLGYELLNPDILRQPFSFSPQVRIEVVLVSSQELEANKQRIERNAYRKAEETFQQKLKVLKQQVDASAINAEQYRQQLQQLQENYDRYLGMINGMAERYARTDYDHLDSIDAQINVAIENGDFDRADSLIHTVFDPTTVLERNRAAKAEVAAKMQLTQDIINRAQADREALIRDSDYAQRVDVLCLSLADEYLVQNNKPKALDCLQQSLAIRQILYGNDSKETLQVKRKIDALLK